jgi:hypothetical protein
LFDDGKQVLNPLKDGDDRKDAIAEIKRLRNEVDRLTAELCRLVPGYHD